MDIKARWPVNNESKYFAPQSGATSLSTAIHTKLYLAEDAVYGIINAIISLIETDRSV